MDRAAILVVDDDHRNRALLRACLEDEHDVVEAASGEEALARAAAAPPDLVLLDVLMPGLGGHEVCRRLKALSGERFLPVILLTALSARDDRHRGLEAGADDFLNKPIDVHELTLRVRTFLRIRESQRELDRQRAIIRQQLEALQVLDALKDDLVSMLVHDLRNPLSGIVGLLGALREDASGATRADLELALATADRLREGIEDLLEVRVLEEGRVRLDRRPQPVAPLLEAARRAVEGAAKASQVEVACEVEAELSACVDAKLIRRAVENVLINAVKHSPRGERVEVAARAEGERVVIAIADRGPGVPDAHKRGLFEKYARLTAPHVSRPGYGLGLYLVKLAAEAHGGLAWVDDRADGGALFQLALPRESPVGAR